MGKLAALVLSACALVLVAQYSPPAGGGGGGGTPGGATTQVQFNNAGAFGGNGHFLYNGTGQVSLGLAGDMAGVSGQHIMGSGAFTDPNYGNTLLLLDADSDSPYALVMVNRAGDTSHYTGIGVLSDGSLSLDADEGNGTMRYNASTKVWAFGPSFATPALTVATLPAAPIAGQRAFVTDSNAVSFTAGIGAIVAAGGSTGVPVVYDGANWRIG